MAGFWRLFRHWRKIRDCYQPHPDVVHLYFFSHHGFTHHYLHGHCLLDEYEEICEGSQKKSLVLLVDDADN